jgi:hypothetical protein
MARQRPNTRLTRAKNAGRGARRLWPYMLMAWERWQSLSPQEKERYKQRARQYGEQARRMAEQRRRRM